MMIKIPTKLLHVDAELPKFKHVNDAGADLKAVSCEYDADRDRFIYGLGFATEIPEGYYVGILPRSGNTKTEVYLPNSKGVIDSDYRGEWKVIYKLRTPLSPIEKLHALDFAPYQVGDKIAQAILEKKIDCKYIEVSELSETERGTDGGINRTDNNFKI